MERIVEWVKNYSMVFLLLTVLASVSAKKESRKYIQLFVEIILVNPLIGAAGKSGDLFEKISFERFWQELEGAKTDREKMDFLNDDYYIAYYERAIEADVGLMAENLGYAVIEANVTLDEEFLVENMELKVAKEGVEPVIIGTVEEEPERMEITALREKIAAYYQIPEDRITILD